MFFIGLCLNVAFASLYKEAMFTPNIDDQISIVIDKKNTKKYYSNLHRAVLNGSSIPSKYKKWFKIRIILKNPTSEEPHIVEGKARITGDAFNHIDVNNLRSSLKIKLKNGNIGGVTVFRLLLLDAVNDNNAGKDEVLWSALMETFGYPTPFRKLVEVNIGGKRFQALFEEGLEKEFIERWGYRESPIIKADERQMWSNIRWNKQRPEFISFVVDNGKFLKSIVSQRVAFEAISGARFRGIGYFFSLNERFAKHGITINNRRFLFDPMRGYKLPVYYDGEVRLSSEPPKYLPVQQEINCNLIKQRWLGESSKSLDFEMKKIKQLYRMRTHVNITDRQECIVKYVLLNSSAERANAIEVVYPRKFQSGRIGDFWDFRRTFHGNGKEILPGELRKLSGINMAPETLNYRNSTDQFYKCRDVDGKGDKCTELSANEVDGFLSGKREPISSTDQFNKIFPLNMPASPLASISKYAYEMIDGERHDIFIGRGETKRFLVTEKANLINVTLESPQTSKVIFSGQMSDVTVNVGYVTPHKIHENPLSRYDRQLLTGCVTFIDVEFRQARIKTEGGACEDAINIVNSNGEISEISIKRAAYDGLDIDFSVLKIGTVKVDLAGNDCMDVSMGSYEVETLIASRCGDKGASVGERSSARFNNIIVEDSVVGLASKDGSIVYADKFQGRKIISECLSAYQKKKEFSGGYIGYRDKNCDNDDAFDRASLIEKLGVPTCQSLGVQGGQLFCVNENNTTAFLDKCRNKDYLLSMTDLPLFRLQIVGQAQGFKNIPSSSLNIDHCQPY